MKGFFPLALLLFLSACGDDTSPRHDVPDDVERCVERQRQLYTALRNHAQTHGTAPAAAGDGFLVELLRSGTLADTSENRALLACPGPAARSLPELDLSVEAQPGTFQSSYAARDQAAHPLTFPSGGRMLVLACEGGNHAGVINALYADGTVRTLELADLKSSGQLPEDTKEFSVGPDSALPELRVLLKD